MGTRREALGYVVVMKPYRKHGNGAVGSGRLGSSGKRCTLFRVNPEGGRTLVTKTEGSTAKDAIRKLHASAGFIPPHVSIKHSGETFF